MNESSENFCPFCGARLKPGSNFCSACGSAINQIEAGPSYGAPPRATPVIPSTAMPLFDPRRRYYTVKREWWTWGSGEIYDERGTVIGHMDRRILSMREAVEFREADNTTRTAEINRKLLAIGDTFEIKDGQDQLIARVKHKIFAPIHPVMWCEDPAERKILEAQGNFLGFSFNVRDMSGNPVAEVDKTDKWKDIFVGGSILDFSQHYAVVISGDVDRRIVVPLAVAIDEAIHEERKQQGNLAIGTFAKEAGKLFRVP